MPHMSAGASLPDSTAAPEALMSNLHAQTLTGDNFPTKKSFREAVAADPSEVLLTCYDFMGPHAGQNFRANEMPEGQLFIVPGPDPQTSRVWFANIQRTGARITVS